MVTASHNPNGWTGIKMGNEKTLTFGPDLINDLKKVIEEKDNTSCLLYTSPSPRD